MIETLAPCPFCGATAQAHKAFPEFPMPWMISVDHADNCFLEIADQRCHKTEAKAITAWNTRHRTAADERVKALEGALWLCAALPTIPELARGDAEPTWGIDATKANADICHYWHTGALLHSLNLRKEGLKSADRNARFKF